MNISNFANDFGAISISVSFHSVTFVSVREKKQSNELVVFSSVLNGFVFHSIMVFVDRMNIVNWLAMNPSATIEMSDSVKEQMQLCIDKMNCFCSLHLHSFQRFSLLCSLEL